MMDNSVEIIDDSSLKNATEAGSYPVIISYIDETGKRVTTEIYVTITQRQTIINVDRTEAISAHDIILRTDMMAQLTDSELLKMMGAKAWLVETGEVLAITTVERNVVDETLSLYHVKIATERGTETTVTAIERESAYMLTPLNTQNQFFNISNLKVNSFYWGGAIVVILVIITLLITQLVNYLRMTKKIEEILLKR